MAIKASELLLSALLNPNGLGLEKPRGVAPLGAGRVREGALMKRAKDEQSWRMAFLGEPEEKENSSH